MTDDELDALVREAVAPTLKVPPDEVTVKLLRAPSLPDHVVFNATRARGTTVNGLVAADGEVIAGLPSLAVAFDVWGAEPPPSPADRAEVVAWILAGDRHVRVVDEAHPAEAEMGPLVRAMVGPPELDDDVLRFWWESRTGLARVEVSVGRRGVDHEIVQAFEIEDGTYDPAGFDAF